MAKKVFSIFILSLFVASLLAFETVRTEKVRNEKVGYELLDRLVGMFQEMAAKGSGDKDKIDRSLEGMMADAKKAYTEKKVDSVFFQRYNRLLMVIKLTIVEDEEGILGPLIEEEVGAFVKDMKGIKTEVKGKKAVGMVANAIAQGVLELHIYLDTKKDRLKLMEEWEKRLKPETKKEK